MTKGEKKYLQSLPMFDAYHMSTVECALGDWLEKAGYFGCDARGVLETRALAVKRFIIIITQTSYRLRRPP
jgi:hypothetical protein